MSNAKIPAIRCRMRQQEILAQKLAGPMQGRRSGDRARRPGEAMSAMQVLDRAGKVAWQLAWGLTHHRSPRATH